MMECTTYAKFQANLRQFFLECGQFVTFFLWKSKTSASAIQNLARNVFALVLKGFDNECSPFSQRGADLQATTCPIDPTP